MKTGKLIINDTILYPPDLDGEVQISMNSCSWYGETEYVSFETLKKWVASIESERIKSSREKR